MIRVEHYEREKHGYADDCDFVVILSLENVLDSDKFAELDLAERTAERVSYTGEYHQHRDEHVTKFFCVHA